MSMVNITDAVVDVASGSGWFEWKVTVGDAITFIGILFAVFEYWRNSKASREQALSNQKESWFLNVIVLPQLEEINTFYKDIISSIENDKAIVVAYKVENFNQCTLKIAKLKQQRKQHINDFFDHICALVMSYDEALGKDVNNIVMALEDVYVRIIDCYVKDEEVDYIREEFLQNKQQLIAKLNSGLKKG